MRYRSGAYRDEVPPAANFLIAVGSVGFLISACVCLYFSTLHHREKVVSIFEQSCSNWTNHYRSQFESANFSISTSHGGPEKAFKLFSSETEKFSHSTSQDPYDPELTIYQPLKYISADSIPNWAFPAPDYDEDKTEYEEVLVTLTADHILPTGEVARSAAAAPAPGAAVGRVVVRAAPTPAPEQKCPLQLHGVYHPKERKCLIYEKLHMICITVDFDASSSSWKLHTQEDGNFGCDPFNDYHAYQYAHVSVGKTPVDHHPIFPQENLTDVRVYVRHARDPYLAAERLAGPRLDFGLGARDWRAVAGVLFLVGGLCLLQPCLRAKEALGERRARRGAGPLWAQIDPRGDSYGDGGDGDEERGGAALVGGGGEEEEEEPTQFDVLRRGGPRWEERRGWDPPPGGGGVAAPSLVTLELPELPPGEVSGAELPSAEVSGEEQDDDDRRRRTPTVSGGGGGGGGAALRRRRPGEGGKRRKKGAAGAAGVAAVPRGRQSATPDPLNPLLSPVMEGDREDGTTQTPQYPPGGGGGGGRAESFSPGPGRGSGGGGGGPRGGEGSGGGAGEGGRAAAAAAADLRASFEAHVTPPPEPVGRMIAAAEARDEAQKRRAMASIINQVEEGAEIEMMPAAAVEEDANKKSGSTSTQQKTLDSPLQLPKGSFL